MTSSWAETPLPPSSIVIIWKPPPPLGDDVICERPLIKSSCKCAAQDEDSTNESCSKIQNTGFLALIVQTLNIASEGQPRLSLSQLKFLTTYVTIFWYNFEWQLSGPGCFFGNFRDTVIWLSELRSFWVGVPGLLSSRFNFVRVKF